MTPVRRSKRTQSTIPALKALKEMAQGESIELDQVVNSKTGNAVDENIIIIV